MGDNPVGTWASLRVGARRGHDPRSGYAPLCLECHRAGIAVSESIDISEMVTAEKVVARVLWRGWRIRVAMAVADASVAVRFSAVRFRKSLRTTVKSVNEIIEAEGHIRAARSSWVVRRNARWELHFPTLTHLRPAQ